MTTVPFGPRKPDDPLLAEASRLPREIEPARDLWPAIAARIAADPGRTKVPPPRWTMALAAGVAIAAVSALLTWGVMRGTGPAPVDTAPPVVADASQAPAAIVPVNYGASPGISEAELAARDALFAEFRAQVDSLRPETRELVARNLVVIQRAVNEIDAALAKEPASRMLTGMLVGAYKQELQLYSMVVTTGDAEPRRT